MRAVFNRELKAYFCNMTGYVFGAFLLLFAGIYMMVINLKSLYPNFEYVLSNMSFIFLVAIPVLTMRSIAEDKKQKTDQLLYSLPLNMTKIVAGKYFSMLAVLAVPVVIMGVYPVILSMYGTVNLRIAYGALLGFFFLGAALISMGMFASSLTESQIVSAVLCFIFVLVNYFISDLANYISGTSTAFFYGIFRNRSGGGHRHRMVDKKHVRGDYFCRHTGRRTAWNTFAVSVNTGGTFPGNHVQNFSV